LKALDSFGLNHESLLPLVQKYQGGDIADWVGFQKELTELLQGQVVTAIKPVNQQQVTQILKDPSHYRAKFPITVTRLGAFEEYQRKRGIVAKTVDMQLSRLKKLEAWQEDNQKKLRYESIETYLDTLDCANKSKKQQHQEQANPFENQHLE